jgi:putative membrane protein
VSLPDPPPAVPSSLGPEWPADVQGEADSDWQRLDSRMLLIGPARALKEFAIPAVIAIIGITSSEMMSPGWLIPGVIGLIVVGAVPWFTTTFRMTQTHFQRRSGLINKEQLTAPLDRIRSVDLESSLLHRVLGLSKVQIGTGVDDTRIELNALSQEQAENLRIVLLTKIDTVAMASDPASGATGPNLPTDTPVVEPVREPVLELAVIDWSWLRFAPFSLGRLVLLAGIFTLIAQFGDDLPILGMEAASAGWDRLRAYSLPLMLTIGSVSALLAWLVVSIGGYVLQWWNLRLVRDNGSLRLTAGLFTTRSNSIEEDRIRGVELTEPGLLRLVGGAELAALATGVGEGGSTTILPACPRDIAADVGERVLDLREPQPSKLLQMALVGHGEKARRRCLIRAQWPTLGWIVVGAMVAATGGPLGWPAYAAIAVTLAAGGVVIGLMAYAHLGHARTPDHLIAGDGYFRRRRIVLEADGVIGWVMTQTWFQRRVGLATLIATTAAGSEKVVIRDVPEPVAIALADAVTPGLLTPFFTDTVGTPTGGPALG